MPQSLTLARNVGSHAWYWATACRLADREAIHIGVGLSGNTEAKLSSWASFSATVRKNFSPFFGGIVATYASAITRSRINSALGSGNSTDATNNSGTITTPTNASHPSVEDYGRRLRLDNVEILALHRNAAPQVLRHIDHDLSAAGRSPNMGRSVWSGS